MFETDYELIERYPSAPRKYLMKWNDARAYLHSAGLRWIESGRPTGTNAEVEMAFLAAEAEEAKLHKICFGM